MIKNAPRLIEKLLMKNNLIAARQMYVTRG